jgi:uncharacterized protein involved in exopolysaccharide biosynthesis
MYQESSRSNIALWFKAVKRHKYLLVLSSFFVMSLIVFGNQYVVPETYEAKALIRVRPVAFKSAVSDTPSVDHESKLLREELLAGSVLQKVVTDLELTKPSDKKNVIHRFSEIFYKDVTPKVLTVDQAVFKLKRKLQVAREAVPVEGQLDSNNTILTLTLRGENPEEVASIVNKIVDVYVEKMANADINSASQSVELLQTRVDLVQEQLKEEELNIAQYKGKHADSLVPEGIIEGDLHDVNLEIATAESAVEEARVKVTDINNRLRVESKYIIGGADSSHPQDLLVRAEAELQDLQMKYYDRHPRVVAQKDKIKRLEKEVKSKKSTATKVPNPVYAVLLGEKNTAISEEKAAIVRLGSLRGEAARLKAKLNRIPQTTEYLLSLESKRNMTNERLGSLITKLTSATLLLNAAEQGVGNFGIVDRATVPESPIGSPRLILSVVGIVVGFGFSLFLVLVRDFIDKSIHDKDSFKEVIGDLGVDLVAVIPKIRTPKDKFVNVWNFVFYSAAFGYFAFICTYIVNIVLNKSFILK